MGLILNYGYPSGNPTPVFDLACADDCNSNSSCASMESFEVGEDIRLRSGSDEDVVVAEVLSKVFTDDEGNYIEQTVSVSSCSMCGVCMHVMSMITDFVVASLYIGVHVSSYNIYLYMYSHDH